MESIIMVCCLSLVAAATLKIIKEIFFLKRRQPPKESHGLNAVALRLYVHLH